MAEARFSWPNFLIRWAVALALVFATFNPSRFSYFAWVSGGGTDGLPLKALAGIVLLIVYIIFLRATWRSIGPIGLFLSVAFFGAMIWVLIDFGLIVPGRGQEMTYVVLVVMSSILAIGVSWSHVRRRVTGQVDADEIED
ncbi:MAG: hypothetical protein HKM95_09230 [Inquilinus sp.]|nr:hypothetical protein [Inquilinus sp.]